MFAKSAASRSNQSPCCGPSRWARAWVASAGSGAGAVRAPRRPGRSRPAGPERTRGRSPAGRTAGSGRASPRAGCARPARPAARSSPADRRRRRPPPRRRRRTARRTRPAGRTAPGRRETAARRSSRGWRAASADAAAGSAARRSAAAAAPAAGAAAPAAGTAGPGRRPARSPAAARPGRCRSRRSPPARPRCGSNPGRPPGRAARTAAPPRSLAAWAACSGSRNGGTRTWCSPYRPSATRLVTSRCSPGAAASSRPSNGACSTRCSMLSATSSTRAGRSAAASWSSAVGRRLRGQAQRAQQRHRDQIGVADRRQVRERRPVREPAGQLGGRLQRDPGLAGPAGPGQRDQPALRPPPR